jgi:hypothetical protein
MEKEKGKGKKSGTKTSGGGLRLVRDDIGKFIHDQGKKHLRSKGFDVS